MCGAPSGVGEPYRLGSLTNLTHDPGVHPVLFRRRLHGRYGFGRQHGDQADSEVEHVPHLLGGNPAGPLQDGEVVDFEIQHIGRMRLNVRDPLKRTWEKGIYMGADSTHPEAVKRMEGTSPVRRIGQPDDIAGLALFLASDASNFVTGQTIVADGGSRMRV